MAFKRLLMLLRSYPEVTDTGAIVDAVDIAAAWKAQISALSCAILPRIPRSPLASFTSFGSVAGPIYSTIECGAREVSQTFVNAARERGVFGQDICRKCAPDEVPAILAGYARLHDLTILPMLSGGYLQHLHSQWYAETALFETARPVLALPKDFRAAKIGSFANVAIGWDNSRAAARAIADALPLLQRAKSVRVVTIVNEKTLQSDPPLADILKYLAAHDVRAVHDEIDASREAASTLLESYLAQHSSDLMVMGAYGRSRLREFVLGGMTKHMLTHAPLPVFLSH